jgi:hypothetical protein
MNAKGLMQAQLEVVPPKKDVALSDQTPKKIERMKKHCTLAKSMGVRTLPITHGRVL